MSKPEEVRCETCAFWVKHDDTDGSGECHCHPPGVFPDGDGGTFHEWPAAWWAEFCGEWMKEWPRE